MSIVPQFTSASYSPPPMLALPAPRIAGLLPARVPERVPPNATASEAPRTESAEPNVDPLDVATAAFRATLSRASDGQARLADVIQAALDAYHTVMYAAKSPEEAPVRPPQPNPPLLVHPESALGHTRPDLSKLRFRSIAEMNAELVSGHEDTLRYFGLLGTFGGGGHE